MLRSRPVGVATPAGRVPARSLLDDWLAMQGTNLLRHVASLHRFTPEQFGKGENAPSEAHIEAANKYIGRFKDRLTDLARGVDAAVKIARREPTPRRLQLVLIRK